jgi:type VI secretion system protein ImpK
MSSSERVQPGAPGQDARSSHNLAFFSQGVLTAIERLQRGRDHMPDAQTFRRRTITSINEIEREARSVGYSGDDIKNVEFALVAFLDSVVLNSSEPGRADWERESLAMERFKIANAGDVFFEKLDTLKMERDSHHLADVLEVYLLCLLLGFQGRYAGSAAELSPIVDRLRRRIDGIRGRQERLSPTAALPETAAPIAIAAIPYWTTGRYRVALIAAGGGTILLFILLKLSLIWEAGNTLRSLLPL